MPEPWLLGCPSSVFSFENSIELGKINVFK